MKEQDFEKFAGFWNAYTKTVTGKSVDEDVMMVCFDALMEHPLSDIRKALRISATRSQWRPTPASITDILREIGIGSQSAKLEAPTASALVAQAQSASTPLGVMFRAKIGHFDLNNQDSFYLNAQATNYLLAFDDIVADVLANGYSKSQKELMNKYNIALTAPLAENLPGPSDKHLKLVHG